MVCPKAVPYIPWGIQPGALGLAGEKANWSYKLLAHWLTEQGYPVTESDVKNAKRSRIDESVAATTPDVGRLLDVLKAQFPRLELERFLVDG